MSSLLPVIDFPPQLLCTAWLGVGEVPVIKGSVDKDVPGEAQCPPPSVEGCWSWDGAWWAVSMTTESRECFFRMVAFMGSPCLPAVSILSSTPHLLLQDVQLNDSSNLPLSWQVSQHVRAKSTQRKVVWGAELPRIKVTTMWKLNAWTWGLRVEDQTGSAAICEQDHSLSTTPDFLGSNRTLLIDFF